MPSSLFRITDTTQPPTNPNAHYLVLADSLQQAQKLVLDEIAHRLGDTSVGRCDLWGKPASRPLYGPCWKVLCEGELYHPGSWIGILDGSHAAIHFEESDLTDLVANAKEHRLAGRVETALFLERTVEQFLREVRDLSPNDFERFEEMTYE